MAAYYAGDEEHLQYAKPFGRLLEITHQHLFAMPITLLVASHLYQMTRRRVGLSDPQMNQLIPINQRFEGQRRAILRQERETRLALRDAMRDSAEVDQGKITGYLDKLVQLQHQRVDLIEQEQRDLAQFMTPLQRARYTALQE